MVRKRVIVLFVLLGVFQAGAAWANVIQIMENGGLQGADMVIKAPQRESQLATGMVTGDFNGDGIKDLAVGAPRSDSPRGKAEAGNVSVFFGGEAFAALPSILETIDGGKEDLLLSGSAEHEFAGERLAAGDLNGDKIDDLVIVAQWVNDTGAPVSPEAAKIYIVYGSASLSGSKTLSTSADVVIARKDSMHVAGVAVGDVNKDNVADLLVVDDLTDSVTHPPLAPLVEGFARGVNGAVYVFFGGALGASLDPAADTDAAIMRAGGAEIFQSQSIALGDFNGDGNRDIILGVPTGDNTPQDLEDSGRVYLVDGASGISGNLDIDNMGATTIYGALERDKIGVTLGAGDLNNDNRDDIVIGAPLSGWGQAGSTGFGKVQVVYGRDSFGPAMDLFDDTDIYLALGEGVARIGFKTGQGLHVDDINGDGVKDIIIATTNAFSSSGTNGWVHTVFGTSDLKNRYDLDTEADLTILAPEGTPTPGDPLSKGRLGSTISVADLDNDGKADMVLGAPWGLGNNDMVGNGWAAVLFKPLEKKADEPCILFGADGTLPIPHLTHNDQSLGISFRYAGGMDFTVDLASITGPDETFDPVSFAVDFGLHLPCVNANGTMYEFTLRPKDPSLADLSGWTIDPATVVTKENR